MKRRAFGYDMEAGAFLHDLSQVTNGLADIADAYNNFDEPGFSPTRKVKEALALLEAAQDELSDYLNYLSR
jgi:hypothetical protein